MLIPEEEAFLTWMSEQPDAVSIMEMGNANAPGFQEKRVRALLDCGMLERDIGIRNGKTFGVYTISDDGKRALLEMQQIRDDRAHEESEHHKDRSAQIRAALISAAAGAGATLLVEHFPEIISWGKSFFH